MNAPAKLNGLGQSLWLDNITRALLDSGTLQRYIDELSVTGLTSNPTIYDHALKGSADYDEDIRRRLKQGESGEALFFGLALQDLTRAADLFRPVHRRTRGVDGWVSLEVSPLLAHDTQRTLAAARELQARAARPNLFIKIPGTAEGLPAIEEATFAGVPVNVTLLFSTAHYRAAAEAWLRGVERRLDAGLSPDVGSVASLFVSRWDAAVAGKLPEALYLKLGIAIGRQAIKAYRDFRASAPSLCKLSASPSRSMPAARTPANTASQSAPSAGAGAPTRPWSAKAFSVPSGIVLMVNGAASAST
jgi:transaldolase